MTTNVGKCGNFYVTAEQPEGPHLYKREDYYYLKIAEGGTSCHHAVTVARSKTLIGTYEGNPSNPILTHRHLGRKASITCTGHGDLVETPIGEWWMVLLGCRPYGGSYSNMGRETFLVPVEWEDGWPVVNPGRGMIEEYMKAHDLPLYRIQGEAACDHFETDKLAMKWVTLRNPEDGMWSLTRRKSYLSLKLRAQQLMKATM